MENKFEYIRLGDYITQRSERNSKLQYGAELIEGVNNNGEFCKTKAYTQGINMKTYKVVRHGDIAYNPARLNIGSVAYREGDMCIVSHLYIVFYLNSKGQEKINPLYLYLYFKRAEFGREVTFRNFGSQRPEFDFKDIVDIIMPLPSMEKQNKVVEIWKGLHTIQIDNEAIAEPLEQLCRSYMQKLKHSAPMSAIGNFISPFDIRNKEKKNFPILGINKEKRFMPTVANTKGLDTSKYKVIRKGQFVFSGMQTGRDVCIRIALYEDNYPALLSPAYTTFTINNNNLLPEFLFMCFKRSEMDRYGWFISDSSVRSNLDWNRFMDIKIPLPSIKQQEAIVDLYNCAFKSRKIAEQARKLSNEVCPALMQKAIRG